MNEYTNPKREVRADIMEVAKLAVELPQPSDGIVRRRFEAEKSLFALKDFHGKCAVGFQEGEDGIEIFERLWATRLLNMRLKVEDRTFTLIMVDEGFGDHDGC